jgi:tetrahydromethanopterin S-methyltransferase subunit B
MLARLMHRALRRLQGRHPVFIVNSGAGAEPIRVNLRTVVNAADIRTETEDGREYLVLPSYTLPDGVVMNGGLYTKEEIDASYKTLEDTPAPMGHPMADGKYISAYHPKAINAYYAGAFNRNVRREGNRVYLEKWVDTEFAKNNERGRQLLDAVATKQPVHTSTGILLEREPVANADGYTWIARNMKFDHDAILVNETGAATPDQGVGLFVNVSDAVPALTGLTYGSRREALCDALKEVFAAGDQYLYVDDFDDRNVVYSVGDDSFRIGYTIGADGKVTLVGQPVEAEPNTGFSITNIVNKILTLLPGRVVSKPAITPNSEALDMTPEELKAALDASAQTIAAANAEAVAKALEPIQNKLTSLEQANADLSAKLQANTAAAEAEKKTAVAAEFGEVVANSLTGEALDAMFAKCAKAAPLLSGLPVVNTKDGLADTLPE